MPRQRSRWLTQQRGTGEGRQEVICPEESEAEARSSARMAELTRRLLVLLLLLLLSPLQIAPCSGAVLLSFHSAAAA